MRRVLRIAAIVLLVLIVAHTIVTMALASRYEAELGDLPTDPYSGEAFRYEAIPDLTRLWCARDREWELNAGDLLAWEWSQE